MLSTLVHLLSLRFAMNLLCNNVLYFTFTHTFITVFDNLPMLSVTGFYYINSLVKWMCRASCSYKKFFWTIMWNENKATIKCFISYTNIKRTKWFFFFSSVQDIQFWGKFLIITGLWEILPDTAAGTIVTAFQTLSL